MRKTIIVALALAAISLRASADPAQPTPTPKPPPPVTLPADDAALLKALILSNRIAYQGTEVETVHRIACELTPGNGKEDCK